MQGSVATMKRPAARTNGAAKRVLRFNALDYALIPGFLLAEIGLSYWMSFATLFAAFVAWRWRDIIWTGLSSLPVFVFVPPLFFISLLIEPSQDLTQDVLHISRETLFWLLFCGMLEGLKQFTIEIDRKKLEKILLAMALFVLVLCAYQWKQYSVGVYFGIPKQYFAQGQGTIASDLDLAYSHLRPSATVAEPSYLAFIIISILFSIKFFEFPGGNAPITSVILIITGLISQSMSFVMFLLGLCALALYTQPRFARYRASATLIGSVALLVLLTGAAAFLSDTRLAKFGSTSDYSTFVRVIGPVIALPEFIAFHPFGTPSTSTMDMLEYFTSPYGMSGEEWMQNFLFNSIFLYGFGGIFIVYFLLKGRGLIPTAYIFVCMFFNGGMLNQDKFFVMSMTFIIFKALSNPNPKAHNQPARNRVAA